MITSADFSRVAEEWGRVSAAMDAAISRFAPSPTGDLHLGHVAHLAWLDAVREATGARVLVRIEDHDRSRCTPANEASILADLDWLGFAVDTQSRLSLASHPSPYRQSDMPEVYAAAFARLRDAGLLYGCTCTRGDLPPPDEEGERRYPGTCRGQPIEREGKSVVRVMLPDGEATVQDLLLGELRQRPLREHGDPVIRDAMGQWTYQFAVVVDDLRHGVNLIVRGDDLRSSTGRQLLLGRLLGREAPFVTVHHPLLLGSDGRKLSKRDGSTAVRTLREAGRSPAEVIALALGGQFSR